MIRLCREVKDFIKFLPQRLAIGLTLHERLKAPPPSPYRGIRFKARPVTGFDFLICKQGQAITVDRKGTHPACSHSFKHFRPDGIMHRAILFGSAGFELHCPSAPYRQDASRKRIFAPNPASKPCSFPGATESLKVPPMRAEMRTEPIPYPLVRSTSTLQKSDVSWSISASPIHDAPPGARRSPLAREGHSIIIVAKPVFTHSSSCRKYLSSFNGPIIETWNLREKLLDIAVGQDNFCAAADMIGYLTDKG